LARDSTTSKRPGAAAIGVGGGPPGRQPEPGRAGGPHRAPARPAGRQPGFVKGGRVVARARRTGLALLVAGLWAGAWAAPRVAPVSEPAGALRPVRRPSPAILEDDGDRASLAAAVRQSLAWLERESPERVFAVGSGRVTAGEQVRALRRFLD